MSRAVGERAPFDDERQAEAAFERKAAGGGKRDNAGQAFHPALRIAHELIYGCGGIVARSGEGHFHGENFVRRETWIHTAQRCKSADEQSSADQEHESERDFGDNQSGASLVLAQAAAGARAAFLEGEAKIGVRGTERRYQPK